MKRIVWIVVFGMHYLSAYEAFVKVPVADLVDFGQAPKDRNGKRKAPCQVMSFYANGKRAARLGQVLFNETVEVLEENGELARIREPKQFYIDAATKELKNEYWIARNALAKTTENIKAALPAYAKEPVILLIPYTVPELNITLSLGTRFTVVERKEATVKVRVFHPRRRRIIEIDLPNEILVPQTDDKRALFVALAREIANADLKTPYVWGGSSSIDRFAEGTMYTIAKSNCPHGDAYQLPDMKQPFTGFDCSGLVMRLLDMLDLDIPVLPKNSLTLKEYLGVLSQDQQPQNGDIIYIPGHVIIITDIDHHLVTEARTPEHGYGFVHETTIDKLFEGLYSIQELHEHASKEKVCKRVNKDGECIAHVAVSILPLATLLEQSKQIA